MKTSARSLRINDDEAPRILLVEDDPRQAELYVKLLSRAGAEVVAVVDGMQAIELVVTGASFHLFLIDLTLPHVNGLSVTRTIRTKGCTTPIIGITAYSTEAVRRAWLRAGCNRFLAKPLHEDVLLEEVAATLEFSTEDRAALSA